jgi:hypothetical protein
MENLGDAGERRCQARVTHAKTVGLTGFEPATCLCTLTIRAESSLLQRLLYLAELQSVWTVHFSDLHQIANERQESAQRITYETIFLRTPPRAHLHEDYNTIFDRMCQRVSICKKVTNRNYSDSRRSFSKLTIPL